MSGAWFWPAELDPREPFAEAPLITQPGRARLAAIVAEAEAGTGAAPPDLTRRLGAPLAVDSDVPPIAGNLPSEEDLVRIAAEHDPGVVGSASDVVLGPWADLADRHSRLVAVAWGALIPGDGWDTSPVARWLRSKPGPPSQVRPGVVAVLRTPPGLWRITGVEGDRIEVRDLLGLPSPAGPVRLRPPAEPIGASDVLMARIVATPTGPEAVIPIRVPWGEAIVARWQRWAPLAARAANPRVQTLADVLRARGHQLARRLLESAWTPER